MNDTPGPQAGKAGDVPAADTAGAQRDLVRVQHEVDAARAVLLRLLQEVVVAESRLHGSQAARMLEANEQLVTAALRDQAAVEAAEQSLNTATRLSETDPLTRLPNRWLLQDRFAQATAAARRHGHRLALLFLDLDDFKQVNDRMGHQAGDEALQKVALRLGQATRGVDTVSRHGGDEFLILLTDVSQPADAAVIAGQLLAALQEPFHVLGRELHLSASIGVSIYPDDGESLKELIGRADAAMYRAKSQGASRIAVHGDQAPPAAARAPQAQLRAAQERRDAQLQEANEQLVLAAMDAQDLQAAAERAQQRQADFMAAVAEELHDPFAPIRVAAAMLGRDSDDAVLLRRAQGLVEQQAAHMSRLVQAASVRARAAGLLHPGAPQPSDLAVVIDAAVRDARPLMDLRQQHLTVVVPAGTLAVQADADRMGHVLDNLLDNASKYTSDHGTIRLEAVVQGASVVLSVIDDGIGIRPDAVSGIFEPFGQDSSAIGFNGASRGIGLPVVRVLVTELGGTVRADSAGNGRGSRFVVTLPLAGAGASGPAWPGPGPGGA